MVLHANSCQCIQVSCQLCTLLHAQSQSSAVQGYVAPNEEPWRFF
jgi:hypothetical protein